ncbi:MAG: tRNA (adenosine(37)-N6)-threonylcarbamoyltransferase complex dimerization subunit type 1 TsaB [Candidatus Dormibacteria bacterium]
MILAFDTSGAELAVAAVKPSEEMGVTAIRLWPGGWGTGLSRRVERRQEALFEGLDEILSRVGGAAAVTAVAVVRGPGSYTGLRSGLSAAAGFAFSRRLEIHPVSSLAVAAHRIVDPGEVVALVAAGRGRVHARRFTIAGAQRVPRGAARLLELNQLADWSGPGVTLAGEPGLVGAVVAAGGGGEGPGVPAAEALAAAVAEAVGAGEVVRYDRLTADYGEA